MKHVKSKVALCCLLTASILISNISINFAALQPQGKEDNSITIISDSKTKGSKTVTTFNGNIVDDKDINKNKEAIAAKNEKISDSSKQLKLEQCKIDTVNSSDVGKLNSIENSNIIVDTNTLSNIKLKEKIKDLYDSGSRVVLKKDNISREDIINYTGIDEEFIPSFPTDIGGSTELKTVGAVVIKLSNNSIYVNLVNVDDYNNEQAVENALVFAAQPNEQDEKVKAELNKMWGVNYDNKNKVSLISFGTSKVSAQATYTNWTPVTAWGTTDSYSGLGNVQRTAILQKYNNNPINNNTDWLFSMDGIISTFPSGAYKGVTRVTLGVNGNGYGSLYDYIPRPQYGNILSGSISLGGISLSCNVGSSVDEQFKSGGPGSNWVELDYYPSVLGMHYGTSDPFTSEIVGAFSQNIYNCYKYNGVTPYPHYYMSTFRYDVYFADYDALLHAYTPNSTKTQYWTLNGY